MAEGTEIPGSEPSGVPEGSPRRTEGDLLAERRARRAADSGEAALLRRADAAEATVQTLERHVASLQQRLREAEDERGRMAELLDVERASGGEREVELRRVKQREYAEQQLRVEAEERLAGLDRESRAEIDRLGQRLDDGEQDTGELAGRVESLERQLAEAERLAAADRAALRRAEQDLQGRLAELELRVSDMHHGLEAERSARERSERLLEAIGEGHGRMETLLGDMRGVVERLSGLLAARAAPGPEPSGELPRAALADRPPPPQAREGLARGEGRSPLAEALAAGAEGEARGAEMADALAAAVERLRARAEAAAGPVQPPAGGAPARTPHKHSMSLMTRWRIRRKQRRGR